MGFPLDLPYDEKYVQFDYEARTDGNPIYAGYSAPGVADSDLRWTIKKFTYDGNSQCTKIQIITKASWTLRATAGNWS